MNQRHSIKCCECGRFISFHDPMIKAYYEPDSDRGSEIVEWTCGSCVAEMATLRGEQNHEPAQ